MSERASLWRNRVFVRMFSAFSISIFGFYLDIIAIFVLVGYTWKADPVLVGLIPVTYALPMILFSSWAGTLADRINKLKIMVFADILIALMTFALVFVSNIYWLLGLLAIRSTFACFFRPAGQSLTKHVVHEEQLAQATTWNGLADQVGKIAAPLLGAILLTIVSPQICLVIRGVSNLCSAIILLSIGRVEKEKEETNSTKSADQKGAFSTWLEGWHYVWNRRVILSTIFYGLIVLGVVQIADSQFPVIFRQLFPHSPELIGWIVSVIGLGGVCGALWIKQVKKLRHTWLLGMGIVLVGFGFGAIGLFTTTTPIFLAFIAGFIAGIGVVFFFISFNVILQQETEKETVGRVFGIQDSLMSVMMIIAPVTSGWLVHLFGVSQIYLWVGSVAFLLGWIAILFQNRIWYGEKSNMREEYSQDQSA